MITITPQYIRSNVNGQFQMMFLLKSTNIGVRVYVQGPEKGLSKKPLTTTYSNSTGLITEIIIRSGYDPDRMDDDELFKMELKKFNNIILKQSKPVIM